MGNEQSSPSHSNGPGRPQSLAECTDHNTGRVDSARYALYLRAHVNANESQSQRHADPRPLTELCATVQAARTGTHPHESVSASASSDVVMCGSNSPRSHVLQEFTEQASLVELRVLLKHVLTKLGYDPTATSLIMNGDDKQDHPIYGGTFALPDLPQTFDPSRVTNNNNVMQDENPVLLLPSRDHEALVVTAERHAMDPVPFGKDPPKIQDPISRYFHQCRKQRLEYAKG
eukprot:scaffold244438_cov27-Attheya_sp.AAC.1